ncbi:MAG: TraR/DksA C4-type zinc finger protein [Pseudomonadota bacterium]
MNEHEYKQLLDTLMRKRIELQKRAVALSDDNRTSLSRNLSEQAVQLENADALAELGREVIDELGKINMALARGETGQYGVCIECGDSIPLPRLRAVPWAAHCVTCAINNEVRKLR